MSVSAQTLSQQAPRRLNAKMELDVKGNINNHKVFIQGGPNCDKRVI